MEFEEFIVLFAEWYSKGTTTAISGTWSLDISLDAGDHSVSVTSMDDAGNISTSSTALLVSIDTSAPSTPAMPDLDTADDTGVSNTDHITKQNANLTFLGTAEASSTVELFYDVTNSKGTTVAVGGNWSYTTSLFDGTHGITVTATDVAGNKSATSSSMSITIDTGLPSAPSTPDLDSADDDGASNTDNITSLTDNLTFSGTAEASSTVELFAGSTSKGTTTAILGNWSFDISLAAGTYNMTAVATDAAGNASLASTNISVTVGSIGFAFPSEPDLDSADDTGTSNSDNVTKNTTGLTFIGNAEIDSTVIIYDGATPLGTTTATLGNYSFNLSLDSGIHSLSVFSYNATSSATSTALSLTIDTSNPATPSTPDFDAADDTGLYDNDNITKNTSNLTYSGTAETDSVVTIYLDDISRGTSVATGGNWLFSGSIPEGTHYLYVTATDLAGNISPNSGSIMMIIDTTNPNAPSAPDLDPADDSGVYDYDNITNIVAGLTFSGTAEASSTVELFDGAVSKGTIFASSSAWVLDASLPVGTHNISAKSTDLAGNISNASTPNVLVITDTTAPSTPSAPDLDSADDTGSSDSDNITKNTTGLTFSGTAEVDMIVEIFDGATSKGTTTAAGGNWSFDISLSAGVHSLTTMAMDVAGNYSSSSAALSVTVDTSAPAVPSIPDLDAVDDTGSSNSDNITKQVSNNTFTGTGEIGSTVSLFRQKPGEYFPAGSMLVTDGTWTFNMFINPGVYSLWATAADAAGNVSATSTILSVTVDTSVEPLPSAPNLDSSDDTGISNSDNITSRTTGLTFAGTAEATSTIELFDGAVSMGTTTAISGNYSFDISLSAGDHSMSTVATDIAGNISTTSPILLLVIDTSAPAAPGTPDLDAADDTGLSSSDHITKNTSGLTFYGSGETGSAVEVFDGAISKGTVTATSSNWSLDISLSDGVHSITAVATDAAGNSSSVSGVASITVDTSIPVTPSAPDLAAADDTGISDSDNITKQTANLTFTGTAEASSTVEFFCDGSSRGTTVAVGGTWSFDNSPVIGTRVITINSTDVAGNVSATSSSLSVTIDNALPTVTQVTPVPTPTNDTTPNYTFNSTEAGTITYGGTAGCSSITTSALVGNNTITFSTLASGAYSCQITVTDTAGNASSILHVNDFTVDTVAPIISEMTTVATPTNNTTPSLSFHSSEAGTITYGGTAGCTSTTTSAVDGHNTIIFSALGSGTYSCTIRVTDAAGNQSSVFNINTFVVDLIAPTITGVTSSVNNDTYNLGEIIPIQVNFSEDVVVTGVPQITLTTGSPATTVVDYSSGSGSNSLIFNYTVATGNLSADLDYSATTALALNSGTIKDEVGNNATLTLASPGAAGSLGANKNIVVDSSALIITITAPTNTSNSAITDTTIHITDSDGVLVSGVSASSSTVIFDSFNCTQTDANTVDCTINITGSGDLTINAIDSLSNPYSATESGYIIDTTFPETSITGSPELTTSLTDATFTFSSNESGTFECRLDGGVYAVCTSPHTYNNLIKGSHTFEVRAIDDLSNTDATPASFTWTINGSVASVPAPVPPSVGDGQSVVVVPPGESRPLSPIVSGGVNVLLYPSSELYAPVLISSTYTQEEHIIRIIDLDLLNNIATIQIESVPVTVKIKLDETANVDLDADNIPDISVEFANLNVNLMELTIKSLLGEKPVVIDPATYDLALANKLKGRILLQVESHGEAWYGNPKDGQKYYMASGDEAYQIMRKLSVGITNSNLNKVKTSAASRKKFIGKIFLQVESHGEAYYISSDNQITYLKDGAAAYQLMRKKGLGITTSNINKIPTGVLSK
ncbi:MAG: Ig-like domain-containing protein [Candidatus Falkowbacteria bacterium]